MHAEYEASISYDYMNVKVDNRQTDIQANKQTGQKQYAPDHSIRVHKKSWNQVMSEDLGHNLSTL